MNMRDKALKLWDYLAVTGCSDKGEAYRVLDFTPDAGHCPLCELALAKSRAQNEDCLDCKDCLLYNKWHGEDRTDHQTCMDSGTYVEQWYQAGFTFLHLIYARAVYNNLVKEWKPDSNEHEG